MHCNGKCQLMKKIAGQEKNEQSFPGLKLVSKAEVVSSRSSYAGSLSVTVTWLRQEYPVHLAGSPVDQPSSFFHPPGA